MELNRASGILAHPTSFPSPFGIGDLGCGAYEFVSFLIKSGQSLWQILPLNPTGFGDSPYQSSSTYAMNELLICPLSPPISDFFEKNEISPPWEWNTEPISRTIDYGQVIEYKHSLYRKAFSVWKSGHNPDFDKNFNLFCLTNKSWLEDYALFWAIKRYFIEERKFAGETEEYMLYEKKNLLFLGSKEKVLDYYHGGVWDSWPLELAKRDPAALVNFSSRLSVEIEYVKFLQFVVFSQWLDLKTHANESGIKIIGDLPIFVAYDSADTWVNRDLFLMEGFNPAFVAGVPPDYFSETGQLWGNPSYNWERHKATGFQWWIDRMRHTLALVDIVRIDHFRGFEATWNVPYGAKDASTASGGRWVKGRGMELFSAITKNLGNAPIIAEDLGIITEEVTALRKAFCYPGMRILQFGMEGGAMSSYMPHSFEDDHTVAYTGTHDNDTTVGWYAAASEKTRDYFRQYMNTDGESPSWDLLRLLFSSSAKWVIAPIQDILSLGSKDRMNEPGTKSGNWRFRFTKDMLVDGAAAGLRYFSELFGRNADMLNLSDEFLEDNEDNGDNGILPEEGPYLGEN